MNQSSRNVMAVMLAASFASTIGGLPFNSLPILLGSLADSFGFSAQQVGLLGSACFGGYLLGTLIAAAFMDRLPWRKLTLVSAFGAAGALLLSSRMSAEAQMPLWVVIGFFAALMTCLGLRIMGDMVNKERAFGLRLGIELGVTSAVLFALPALVIADYGYHGAALVLAAIIVLLSLSAFSLPRRASTPPAPGSNPLIDLFKTPLPAWFALGFFFVFLAGQIGLWAFLERLGSGLQLAPAEMGIVFSVLKLLGGAAALALALIGDRLGLRLPHFLVFAVIVLGLVMLARADGFWVYALGAWIWEVGFTWGCIYQTAAIARLDPSGRATMLIPAAFGLGSMAGPGIAGSLVADGFAPLLWMAFATALIAVVVYGLVISRRLAGGAPTAEEAAPVTDVM